MAGHSKWANVKHRKARADAQKGKIFTRLAREITVAAKEGGGDINLNFRLRLAVQKAREANLPSENITRAIQKGLGEIEGAELEQVTYEGYGPGGIAVLIEIMTDNRNRTAPEIRHIFSRRGGNMGESGCVAWMFKRKGYFTLDKEKSVLPEDDLMMIALENGADDFKEEEGNYIIISPPEQFESIRDSFLEKKIEFSSAEVTMVPENTIILEDPEEAAKALQLLEALEEHDDVQNVYANIDIPDEIMQSLET